MRKKHSKTICRCSDQAWSCSTTTTHSKTVRMTINNFPNENEEKLFSINPDPCVIETSQFEIDQSKFRIDVYPEYFPGNYGVTLFTDSDLPISLQLKVNRWNVKQYICKYFQCGDETKSFEKKKIIGRGLSRKMGFGFSYEKFKRWSCGDNTLIIHATVTLHLATLSSPPSVPQETGYSRCTLRPCQEVPAPARHSNL